MLCGSKSREGSDGQLSVVVSHEGAARCWLGLQAAESSTGLDIHVLPFAWLGVDAGCWLCVTSAGAVAQRAHKSWPLQQNGLRIVRLLIWWLAFPRTRVSREGGGSHMAYNDLALDVK